VAAPDAGGVERASDRQPAMRWRLERARTVSAVRGLCLPRAAVYACARGRVGASAAARRATSSYGEIVDQLTRASARHDPVGDEEREVAAAVPDDDAAGFDVAVAVSEGQALTGRVLLAPATLGLLMAFKLNVQSPGGRGRTPRWARQEVLRSLPRECSGPALPRGCQSRLLSWRTAPRPKTDWAAALVPLSPVAHPARIAACQRSTADRGL